jgi:putative two-component system hydrogenase maturation factor HypX/HoxX
MRILLLVHGFNSLSQRLYVELTRDGHELSLEFDIHERITHEAVDLFRPDLILAPFLKRAIPASIWQQRQCLIVHPGPPGDRGPAALDWAILRGVPTWGVTVLQAEGNSTLGQSGPANRFRCAAHARAACIVMRLPKAPSSPCARRSHADYGGRRATIPRRAQVRARLAAADAATRVYD